MRSVLRPECSGGGVWVGRCFFSAGAIFLLTLFCMLTSGRLMSAVLLSAALHEGGHLLACALWGVKVRAVRVTFCGAELLLEELNRSAQGVTVAAAGPLVNLLCALCAARCCPQQAWAQLFAGASLMLGLFNLLPVLPLDGGRMVCALMELLHFGDCAEAVYRSLTVVLLVFALVPGMVLALEGNSSLLLLILWLLFQQQAM